MSDRGSLRRSVVPGRGLGGFRRSRIISPSALSAEPGDLRPSPPVCHHNSPAGLPPQLSWLLLRYNPESTVRRFLSVSTGKIYTYDLPETRRRVIYTSPHPPPCHLHFASRILADDESSPFRLPSQSHHPFPDPSPPPPTTLDRLDEHIRFCRLYGVSTPCLLKIPDLFKFYHFNIAAECVVGLVALGTLEFVNLTVSTERTPPQFMYWRAQHRSWIKTHPVSGYPIITVAYHCSRFYIIHENGDLATCDVGIGSEGKLVRIPSLKVPVKFRFCYPVALGVELLLVTTVLDHSIWMQQFCCFKLEQGRWSRIQGMGDYTVFTRNTERR